MEIFEVEEGQRAREREPQANSGSSVESKVVT